MSPETNSFRFSTEVIDNLLQAAIRAPSGDNTQPWKFRFRDRQADIILDAGSDDSFFNSDQIASLISCGAAAENMVIAASDLGMSAEIQYPNQAIWAQDAPVASLLLQEQKVQRDPLFPYLNLRHTNRTRFNPKLLTQDECQPLVDCIRGIPSAQLLIFHQREQIRKIASLVYAADWVRTTHESLHKFLIKMIRFSREEAEAAHDGFPLDNLEAGLAGSLFLRIARSWKWMDRFNRVGIGRAVPAAARQGTLQASAIGLLKMSGQSTRDWIEGGRAVQRVWLTATQLGLDFQPMAALSLFRMIWQRKGSDVFSPAHQTMLGKIWSDYDEIFQTKPAESHILLFRLGYGKRVRTSTLRKEAIVLP